MQECARREFSEVDYLRWVLESLKELDTIGVVVKEIQGEQDKVL